MKNTQKYSATRLLLAEKLEQAWKKFANPEANFYLETQGIPEFYLNKQDARDIHQFNAALKRKNPKSGDLIATHVVPNDISGNIIDAKVVIIQKNMGVGKEEFSDFTENSICLNPHKVLISSEGNSFALGMMNNQYQFPNDIRLLDNQPNMFSLFNEVRSVSSASEANRLVDEMITQLITLAGQQENDEDYPTDQPHNNIQNFYLKVLYPLIQLKFAFNPHVSLPPISLLTDDYYSCIGHNDARSRLMLDPSQDYSLSWPNYPYYVQGKKNLIFKGPTKSRQSFLPLHNVKSAKDIMLIQEFPYRSHDAHLLYEDNALHNIAKRSNEFLDSFLHAITEYNAANQNDQIVVVAIRQGRKAGELKSILNQLTGKPWAYTAKNPRSAYLTVKNIIHFN